LRPQVVPLVGGKLERKITGKSRDVSSGGDALGYGRNMLCAVLGAEDEEAGEKERKERKM
jgi:hypothetical protein